MNKYPDYEVVIDVHWTAGQSIAKIDSKKCSKGEVRLQNCVSHVEANFYHEKILIVFASFLFL